MARASESSDEGIEGGLPEDKRSDVSDRADAMSVASSGIDTKSKSDESNASEAEDRVAELKQNSRNAASEVSSKPVAAANSFLVSQSSFVVSPANSHAATRSPESVSVKNQVKGFESNFAEKEEAKSTSPESVSVVNQVKGFESSSPEKKEGKSTTPESVSVKNHVKDFESKDMCKKSPPPTSPKRGTSFLMRDRLMQEKAKLAELQHSKSEEKAAVGMLDLVLNSPSLTDNTKNYSATSTPSEGTTSPTLTQGTPTPIPASTPVSSRFVNSPVSPGGHEKVDNQSLHSSDSGSVMTADSEPSILSASAASMERPARASADRRNSDEIEVCGVL